MFIYMVILININIFMLILTLIKFIKSSMVSYRASNAENFRIVDIEINVWTSLFVNLQIILILIH